MLEGYLKTKGRCARFQTGSGRAECRQLRGRPTTRTWESAGGGDETGAHQDADDVASDAEGEQRLQTGEDDQHGEQDLGGCGLSDGDQDDRGGGDDGADGLCETLGRPGKLATAPSPEAVYAACSRSCRRRWRCCAPADQGEDHPDDATAANAVSAKLDTDTLAGLVTKVQNDKQDPETVAKSWLSQNSLG